MVPRGAEFVGAVRGAMPDGVDGLYDTALLHDAVFAAIADHGSMVVVRGWQPDETERGVIVRQVMVAEALERTDWLEDLRQLVSEGRLPLRVVGKYPPGHVGEAQQVMDAGGLRGRVVIVF